MIVNQAFARHINDFKPEGVLKKLFADASKDLDKSVVLLRCKKLKYYYSLQYEDPEDMAASILKSGHVFLKDIENHSLHAVEDIRAVSLSNPTPKRKTTRDYLSYASKYCSFMSGRGLPIMKENHYPLYDSRVRSLLCSLYDIQRFVKTNLLKGSERNYQHYSQMVYAFRDAYGLQKLTIREIDWFLWNFSKEPEQYQAGFPLMIVNKNIDPAAYVLP